MFAHLQSQNVCERNDTIVFQSAATFGVKTLNLKQEEKSWPSLDWKITNDNGIVLYHEPTTALFPLWNVLPTFASFALLVQHHMKKTITLGNEMVNLDIVGLARIFFGAPNFAHQSLFPAKCMHMH